jgi:hypothetical protein
MAWHPGYAGQREPITRERTSVWVTWQQIDGPLWGQCTCQIASPVLSRNGLYFSCPSCQSYGHSFHLFSMRKNSPASWGILWSIRKTKSLLHDCGTR